MFDPLGIAASVIIRFRIIQQNIWSTGLKWDDEVTPAVLPEFFDTIAELQELSAVAIPRRFFPDKYHDITLHVFTDASYSALAAVAYFVYRQSPTSPREVSFVLGKARVAPLQQHTITKLELQAALLGSRLAKFIQREQRLTINAIHLWTDSTTVLQWIYGSHQRQQIFVANRVAEILENTQAHQWNHCPGEWNPADDGTRGIPFRDFHYSTRWFQGPEFLKKPASDWPLNPAHPKRFPSAGPTTQVNSYPGIEFAQQATEVASELATEEKETTAAEVATEEEDTTAAEVATEEKETTAAEVATEEEEEEEETTATEVAKIDEGKPGATKATVVATVSPLPKTTAYNTVPAHCDTNTVNEIQFGQLPSSIILLYRDISNTLRVDRFSSWKKLVRVTAYVLRAIANFKKLRRPQPPSVTKHDKPYTTPSSFRSLSFPHAVPFLSANEMSASENFLLRSSQHECFANEVKSLSNRQRISSKSRLFRLKPFLDPTQSLRAEGRLRKSPFDYCLKHPMILDGQHRIVQLFVAFIHNSNGHTRLKQTQHILQLEFWILNAGSIIKKIIHRCYDCRRQDAYATYPEMSDLPPYRFPADQPFPFQQTGLDVFGPFASKTPSQI